MIRSRTQKTPTKWTSMMLVTKTPPTMINLKAAMISLKVGELVTVFKQTSRVYMVKTGW